MLFLKALVEIPGHDAARQGRVRGLSRRKCRPRPLLLERLENRLCLSTWSEPVNLGPVINCSGCDNRRPGISSDGLSLYFGTNAIWVSHRASVDDPWGEPQKLGPAINDPGSTITSAPNFSTDQHWMFFFSDRPGGFGGSDIWASYRQDTYDDLGWQLPINLGPGLNTQYNDLATAYFEDPATGITTLYFDSNRPGGLGDLDIYASTLQGFARFGPAVLVPELSSPNFDARAAIRSDGLEMFLVSTRPGGLGNGSNIWVSTRASTLDPWSTPVNLDTPINMDGFDDAGPALSSDGNTLYFHSNRPGGFGVNDLYMSTRQGGGQGSPAPVRRLSGVDPSIVQVLASFFGPGDRGTSGNDHVLTAGQGNLMLPQQTRESQAGALYPAASSPVPGSRQREATDRIFTARPSTNPAPEPPGWGDGLGGENGARKTRQDAPALGSIMEP
jgi:hypothetical protein